MDSLTQIVLGASVGEAVLGKRIGNKAILWGAVAGTLPDLDVILRYFTDEISATQMHRGFSHSFIFAVLIAPLLGWIAKKIHFKSVIHELLWFINGSTNIEYLQENGVRIWNEWADENGNLGPVYGHQWRNWNSDEIDQIKSVIQALKNNPNSRRMLVSAWNPSVLPDTSKSFSENVANGKAALPPCHAFFQFYVHEGKLSCQLYQRSADIFLGVPFNIASYSLLVCIFSEILDLVPGEFICCLLYTSPSPRDRTRSRMPSSA